MSIFDEWPEYGPDIEIKLDITSSVASLIGPSTLKNKGDFDLDAPNILGAAFKNGAFATGITINGTTGALAFASNISVSTNDELELRFVGQLQLSKPWISRVIVKRSVFMKVASGDSVTVFNASTNAMPVPQVDDCFGWNTGRDLKVGAKVIGKDGASQDLRLTTRIGGDPDDASYLDVDLDSSSAQEHVADFGQGTASDEAVEIMGHLRSASSTTTPRQEETWRILFWDRGLVPDYDENFPNAGTELLAQIKAGSGLKLLKT
jgi:hypothetical protein